MKLKKVFIIFALVGLFGLITACGNKEVQKDNNQQAQENENFNKEDFPIVDDEITLKIFAAKSSPNIDWNDNFPAWTTYEDLTNVKVDWIEQIDKANIEEKRNLAIASGTLPDAFYATMFTNSDLLKYGEQGIFIDLKDLIDDYAPNLKKLMEEIPALESGITFPDGNIYSFPNIKHPDYLSMSLGAKPWIDENVLADLDMKIPVTTDEFYDFLTAVKEKYPEKVPFGGPGIDYLVSALKGSFGINNTGSAGGSIDLDPDGDGLRFIPTADKYRKMLDYMNKLYEEELIPQNIFTVEWNQYLAHVEEGGYTSVTYWGPPVGDEHMVSFFPLKGPDGDELYTVVNSSLHRNGQFVITSANEHPAETVRWIDYFYGDEGSKLMHLGVEGESYEEKDGKYVYTDTIENPEGDTRSVDKLQEFAPGGGLHGPGVIKKDYSTAIESREDSLEATERLKPYLPEEIWPAFTYTKEENDFLTSTGNDIEKYAREMRDLFIAGDQSLDDENWEKYVKTIEGMNLAEFMEIQETAYERYSSN